jgi:hypothetical protein
VASLDELAALPRSTRSYRPSMPSSDANELYAGWQAAVQRVL